MQTKILTTKTLEYNLEEFNCQCGSNRIKYIDQLTKNNRIWYAQCAECGTDLDIREIDEILEN